MIRRSALVFALLLVAPAILLEANYPTAEVRTAFTVLSQRSVPSPVEGDSEVADGRWENEQDCTGVRALYQSDDAPVPTGSQVNEDGLGNLQVEAPYGPAAIIMAETSTGNCQYQVAASPTMVIAAGSDGSIAAFAGVLCSALLGYPAVGGEYVEDGELHAVLALLTDPDRHMWQIALGPGSLEQNLSGEETGPDVILGSFTGMLEDGLLVGDGESDNGSLHVEMRCTPFRPLLNTN